MGITLQKINLVQSDPSGDRSWPQVFRTKLYKNSNRTNEERKELQVVSADKPYEISLGKDWDDYTAFLNSDGIGYGIFPAPYALYQDKYEGLTDLEKGTLLINYFENLIEPSNYEKEGQITPERYIEMLKWGLVKEKNQLLIGQMLGQLSNIFWNLLTEEQRMRIAPDLERTLFHCMNDIHSDPSLKSNSLIHLEI